MTGSGNLLTVTFGIPTQIHRYHPNSERISSHKQVATRMLLKPTVLMETPGSTCGRPKLVGCSCRIYLAHLREHSRLEWSSGEAKRTRVHVCVPSVAAPNKV